MLARSSEGYVNRALQRQRTQSTFGSVTSPFLFRGLTRNLWAERKFDSDSWYHTSEYREAYQRVEVALPGTSPCSSCFWSCRWSRPQSYSSHQFRNCKNGGWWPCYWHSCRPLTSHCLWVLCSSYFDSYHYYPFIGWLHRTAVQSGGHYYSCLRGTERQPCLRSVFRLGPDRTSRYPNGFDLRFLFNFLLPI